MPYSLNQIKKVLNTFTLQIWGNKAVIPGDGWSLDAIASALLKYCEEYKIDIVLALAQGIVECHFGVNPSASRSRKTHNIYNVGNVDSGNNHYFPTWEEGIKRYCQLMHNEYNWHDAPDDYVSLNSMREHDFTRPRGGRYASAPNYTQTVWNIGQQILKLLEDK